MFHGNLWTVPVGGGIGRIMKVGTQPVSLVAQFYGNAVHPANTPTWTMRLRISFLFPKLSKEQCRGFSHSAFHSKRH